MEHKQQHVYSKWMMNGGKKFIWRLYREHGFDNVYLFDLFACLFLFLSFNVMKIRPTNDDSSIWRPSVVACFSRVGYQKNNNNKRNFIQIHTYIRININIIVNRLKLKSHLSKFSQQNGTRAFFFSPKWEKNWKITSKLQLCFDRLVSLWWFFFGVSFFGEKYNKCGFNSYRFIDRLKYTEGWKKVMRRNRNGSKHRMIHFKWCALEMKISATIAKCSIYYGGV